MNLVSFRMNRQEIALRTDHYPMESLVIRQDVASLSQKNPWKWEILTPVDDSLQLLRILRTHQYIRRSSDSECRIIR